MNDVTLGILCVLSTLLYVPRALFATSTWEQQSQYIKIISVVQLVVAVFVYVVWWARLVNWLMS